MDVDISHCSIDDAFTRISCKLLTLFEGKVNVSEICCACFTKANTNLGIGYPDILKQNMTAAESVTELFRVLEKYPTHWSWINIHVMEKMASLIDPAIKLVEHYKTVISHKKLQEILCSIPEFEIDETFYFRIVETWNKALEEITLRHPISSSLCGGDIWHQKYCNCTYRNYQRIYRK